MRTTMLFPCFALLVAAAPASSNPPPVASQVSPSTDLQATTPPTGGGKAKELADPDKKICKQLATTGSRLPRRACLTASEWKQVEEDLSH
jgi:hypothetical protein